jgi:hypothetical protein
MRSAPQRTWQRVVLRIGVLFVVSAIAIGVWIRLGTVGTRADAETLPNPALVDRVLAFNGITVAEAVRIFNSRNEVQLIVSDPVVAQRKIGGSFRINQPEQFAAALTGPLGIVVVHEGRTIRLEAAAPTVAGSAPASR